ncbi:MAG: adenosylcobinamide-GDP ribazoletransferase [Methyloceanibacter sp.]
MTTGVSMSGLTTDLKTGLAILTRFPLDHAETPSGVGVARAAWTFPLIGALIGAVAALIYWLGFTFGLHPFLAALLTVGTTLTLTGGFHEDGLADTADGFGGGRTRERKLEIMRDSGIGAYGVSALVLSILLRAGAIASLADPIWVAPALIAAHTGARAMLPVFMWLVPPARQDGLSAEAGRPPLPGVIAAALIGLIVLGVSLGPVAVLINVLLLAVAAGLMAWLCMRQIGGQTGDVLGALEQIGEILILLEASVRL